MPSYEKSMVALLRADGTLAGTGFVCEPGVIVTCAHVIENRDCSLPLTAVFHGGGKVTVNVAEGGWFPRQTAALCDEPDPLCDVAILQPTDPAFTLPPALALAGADPVSGEITLHGYFPLSSEGQAGTDYSVETITSDLQPVPHPKGWPNFKARNPNQDAVIPGMSGSPAFLGAFQGALKEVVGMLFFGEEGGRGRGLLIPASLLARALNKVAALRAPEAGSQPCPALYLADLEEEHARKKTANGCVHAPSQRAQPGKHLEVLFMGAFCSCNGNDAEFLFKRVELQVTLPPGRSADAMLGRGGDEPLSDEVMIRRCGTPNAPEWELVGNNPETGLHGTSPAPDTPLFTLPGARSGEHVEFRMVTYATKDCFLNSRLPKPMATAKKLSVAKERIMTRLSLKELGDPDEDGAITLSSSRHEVREVLKS